MSPLEQIKQQIKHYELSATAFRADADRFHKRAEDSMLMAEEYKKALIVLESHQGEQGAPGINTTRGE